MIDKSKTTFIKGRIILDGVAVLHEVLHEIRATKEEVFILKIDFEKAYDRVRWEFLEEVLREKGFDPLWISWMRQLVRGGQTAVNNNGHIGSYFRNKRGVRQGDPISPLLFNIIVDALAGILDHAKAAGHICGVAINIIPGGISHLQYADDTLIFIKNSEREIINLKFLLVCFEDVGPQN